MVDAVSTGESHQAEEVAAYQEETAAEAAVMISGASGSFSTQPGVMLGTSEAQPVRTGAGGTGGGGEGGLGDGGGGEGGGGGGDRARRLTTRTGGLGLGRFTLTAWAVVLGEGLGAGLASRARPCSPTTSGWVGGAGAGRAGAWSAP